MDNSKKALGTTFILTLLLFLFIVSLLYIIYCYAYYDKYQEQVFLDHYNHREYSFVYKKMVGKDDLSLDEFNSVIDNLGDRDRLSNIYDTYYIDGSIYDKDTFMNTFLFNNLNVTLDNIHYTSNGKTNLFSRKGIFYDYVNVSNGIQNITIGVLNNISFKIEDNTVLKIDDKDVVCIDNVCTIDKIFGGIHEVSYVSNGYLYYGLVNIHEDKQVIDVTNIESLVKVSQVEVKLNYGKYIISKCNLDVTLCPSLSKSYLILNEDGSYVSYMYYTDIDKGNITDGTYTVVDNKIVFTYNGKFSEEYLFSDIYLLGENTDFDYLYVG